MQDELDLYEFPADYVGRKTYVSVRGHSKSVPKYKTYTGTDRHNYLLPEFGGNMDGMGNMAPFYMPDKEGYVSPMDRQLVEGRKAHREHMKRHGVLEAGDMKIGEFAGVERSPMPSVRDSIRQAYAELNR